MTFICIICSLLFLYGFIKYRKTQKELTKLDESAKRQNEEFKQTTEKLLKDINNLHNKRDDVVKELNTLSSLLDQNRYHLKKAQQDTEELLKTYLITYCDNLDFAYQEAERQHDEAKAQLEKAYKDFELKNFALMEAEKQELEKLKATRKAAIEASLREEEIKNKLDFYCLNPKTADINDIQTLVRIKPQLNNPRILSMLIWSTYFQKDMTALCNRVLGLNTIIGIYKITNQQNGKCYIGQSVDIAKRWKDHAKCGLGIDTPAGNKLYKDMQEFGIWNFSWELLESCSREELNEKEKNYIELYQSKDYGYNITKGNN